MREDEFRRRECRHIARDKVEEFKQNGWSVDTVMTDLAGGAVIVSRIMNDEKTRG